MSAGCLKEEIRGELFSSASLTAASSFIATAADSEAGLALSIGFKAGVEDC